jgi:hypothetical protein
MKKLLIPIVLVSLAGCKITVPYFEDLDPKYVCGNFSEDCQPTSSTNYTLIKKGIDFDGDPNHYLGVSYKKYFQRDRCINKKITENDIVISGIQTVTGTLKNESKTKFSNKLSADIVALLKINSVPVPSGLEADVTAEIGQSIKNTDTSKVTLEYKRVDLSFDFIADHMAACQNITPKDYDIATGISVITVSGEWAADNLTNSFASIEASVNYSILSNDAKAEYENAKERVLNGQFQPVSFVFAVANRSGKL